MTKQYQLTEFIVAIEAVLHDVMYDVMDPDDDADTVIKASDVARVIGRIQIELDWLGDVNDYGVIVGECK